MKSKPQTQIPNKELRRFDVLYELRRKFDIKKCILNSTAPKQIQINPTELDIKHLLVEFLTIKTKYQISH